jgi:outer membrane protein OmpA-like peptidoglycan-associated protein
MKRFLTGLAVCAAVMNVSAQSTAFESNKLTDNWSVGIKAGATTPLTHSAFFDNMRPVFGVNLSKELTPFFGVTGEVMASVNTSESTTAFDAASLNLLGRANLSNLFCGWKGYTRLFEMEAVAGFGWGRYIYNHTLADDKNTLLSKVGLNFNFNLGESKAWTIAVRPALVYDLKVGNDHLKFNANQAAWELTAGVQYHFKSSNGKHHFTPVKAYDQNEVDGLNAQINNLRGQLNNANAALDNAQKENAGLKKALNDCQNEEKTVQVVDNSKKSLESVVTFGQGKTVVATSQMPNVERVATYMKHHKDAKVSIKGYASPEGSVEVNERIAKQRAEAVKSVLVNKYKIAANRIEAEGQGVGNMFEEADWNRVSICTIAE